MSYTVFARKYRPRTFDEIVGQDHIVRTLKNAVTQQRLAHAYIFVGPRGTGKTSTARILAKALNCSNGPRADFDPDEPACLEIAEGRSMNVLEFDAASNTQVDKVRELIIENVKYAPVGGKYKVYVVDEVHMLSTSSFNALLKTLEEPPPHVVFVFATTDVQKVPTTILSRCQRFDLKRIPTSLIRDHLLYIAQHESLNLSVAAAESIARGAEGGMRDAESMLDQLVAFCGQTIEEDDVLRVFGFTSQQTVAQLCEHLLAADAPGALGIVHAEAEAGRDLTRLLSELISYFRALLVAQADPDALAAEMSAESLVALQDQAGRIDQARLLDLIERSADAEQRMRWAPNKRMHLEIAIIRAIQVLNQATLTEVLDALTAVRGGAPVPVAPVAPKPAARPATKTVSAPKPSTSPVQVAPAPAPTPASAPASAPAATPTPPLTAAKPAPEPEPETAAEVTSPTPTLDLAEAWTKLVQRVRKERPLQASNIERTVLLEVKGGLANFGIDSQDALALDLLDTPSNRSFFEKILSELFGQPLAMKFTKRDGITPAIVPREPELKPEAAKDPMAEFKEDPLIRKALEIFKAEIQPN